MLTPVVQRWREGRASYRPAREVVDTRTLEVAAIDRAPAREFVERHHYEGTFPAARFRFGLYERAELVGAAIFAQPVRDEITACVPGEPLERVELSRLVLLDRIGANAESWFVARCVKALRREGLAGFVSFSDPVKRTDAEGRVTMPGHVGIVYQALNGCYLGRTRRDTIRLTADGRNLPNRTLAKIRRRDRGWQPAVDRLVALGARPPSHGEDLAAWLARELPRITRKVAHPGKHKFAWVLRARDRRHLPQSLPYPKLTAPRAQEDMAC